MKIKNHERSKIMRNKDFLERARKEREKERRGLQFSRAKELEEEILRLQKIPNFELNDTDREYISNIKKELRTVKKQGGFLF